MIDVSVERPITFNEAARYLPEDRRPNFSTWWRWSTAGVRGVRLETILIGGRRYTTAQAVERFIASSNGRPIQSRTSKQRQRDHVQAVAELQADGI